MQKALDVSIHSRLAARDTRVREAARALGFDAVGVARADLPLEEDFARYESFIDAGMHGEMRYLEENRAVRARIDTKDILENARSVICVAIRYDRPREDEESDAPLAKKIARYARGQDYHNAIRKKLRKLAAIVRTLGAEGEAVSARPICDDVPVLERAWASRAGLGFIGKNGLLIVPGQGSFMLLGEVVTTLALTPSAQMNERCGSCTLCLDACPTDAFAAPRVLDARKCISYLTIELRSNVPVELREAVGDHLFGCDDCQSVCPFNAKANAEEKGARTEKLRVFSPHPRWAETTLGALVTQSEEAFAELARGSPVHRATRDGLAKSAAIVAGNTGDGAARAHLESAATTHPSDAVRDAATWALARAPSVKT